MSYIEHYQQLTAGLPGRELPWLSELRQGASNRFSARGFPTTREEGWRYTPLSVITRTLFTPAQGDKDILTALEPFQLGGVYSVVFVDGRFRPDCSELGGLPAEVLLLPMTEALREWPDRLQSALALPFEPSHGLTDFNQAYFSEGIYLHVPAGIELDRPIQLLHLATQTQGLGVFRHVVELDADAQAQLIETWVGSAEAAYFNAAVTSIRLGEGSRLEHYKRQQEGPNAFHFGGIYVDQADSAHFHQHQVAFGGQLARTEIVSELAKASKCELQGLSLASGRQHHDSDTLIRHTDSQGTSREHYHGIAAERAHGVFSGRIVVQEGAQKTDSEMTSRNLLLSENAEIDSRPQLEIHADDVKCSHGVTVGQLDAEAVFYLRSRGVDERSARNMLTFAFANERVEAIGNPELKRQIRESLLASMPQTEMRGEWL